MLNTDFNDFSIQYFSARTVANPTSYKDKKRKQNQRQTNRDTMYRHW